MALISSLKGTQWVNLKEKYKYKYSRVKKLASHGRTWIRDRIADILNHPLRPSIQDTILNYGVTALIISVVLYFLFGYGGIDVFKKGIGIAITLALIRYYVREYFRIKDKPWKM